MSFTPGVDHAGRVTVRLAVAGMHCSSCVALIEEVLADRPGVEQARAELEAAQAEVTFDPSLVTVDELCAAIAGAGYAASLLEDAAGQEP